MKQPYDSQEYFDAFLQRQYPRYHQYIDQLRRQTLEKLHQVQDTQTTPRSDGPMALEGRFVVTGTTTQPDFQQDLAAIKSLQRAVFRHRGQLFDALILAVFGLFVSPLLAVAIASLALWRFYQRLVNAASAPCPNCGKSFGRGRRVPFTIGDDCQNCGLSLKAQNNQRRANG